MRKRTAVIAGIAVLAIGGGVAYAAWSSTGAGSGTVGSKTSVASVITPVAGTTGLYPGGSVDFQVTISNPNDYPVKVTSIAAGASDETVDGCLAGTVTSAAVSNPTGTIDAGQSGTYTLQATMKADAADNCKSQTFSLPLTAQLLSAA